MNNAEKLVNRNIWKKLILNGLLDESRTTNIKAIEKVMYDVIHTRRARWRDAKSPIYAMRNLIKEGVPLSFLRDNIGIIARQFSWEKSGSSTYYISDSFDAEDKNGMMDICFNGYDYLVISISIQKRKAYALHKGRHGDDCKEIREAEATNDMGIVWTEVLQYYNYVQKQKEILKGAIECI